MLGSYLVSSGPVKRHSFPLAIISSYRAWCDQMKIGIDSGRFPGPRARPGGRRRVARILLHTTLRHGLPGGCQGETRPLPWTAFMRGAVKTGWNAGRLRRDARLSRACLLNRRHRDARGGRQADIPPTLGAGAGRVRNARNANRWSWPWWKARQRAGCAQHVERYRYLECCGHSSPT